MSTVQRQLRCPFTDEQMLQAAQKQKAHDWLGAFMQEHPEGRQDWIEKLLLFAAPMKSLYPEAFFLWRGKVLCLHGKAANPMEQFGVVARVGDTFAVNAIHASLLLAGMNLSVRDHRLQAAEDVRLLRRWMKSHAPVKPLWAIACGQDSLPLIIRLGLGVTVGTGGCLMAVWQRPPARGFAEP